MTEALEITDKKKSPKSRLVMFATDGFHISLEKVVIPSNRTSAAGKAIVRADILELVGRILPSEGVLEIEIGEKKIMFHCEEIDIATQLMGGDFPDYRTLEQAIPNEKTAQTTVVISTLELLRACKQLKVFAIESNKTRLSIGGFLVNYSIETQSRGGSKADIVGIFKGKPIEVGMNVNFLHDFLEVCETPQVVLHFHGKNDPIRFSMEGVDTFYHVIMPIVL